MNTTRNRSAVLAQFLRAATANIRVAARPLPIDDEKYRHYRDEFDNSLATIDGVAEELEAAASAPDPNDTTTR